ncbi:MAG: DUF3094 family protein [Gammaproteobacteria bacterium]|nr:MAG: DUF3094 family protein [Gammaproteobacteria bacterium]
MSDWITPPNELSDEDKRRVEYATHTGYNETERKPFRPWLLFLFLWFLLMVFGGLSYGLAWYHGLV